MLFMLTVSQGERWCRAVMRGNRKSAANISLSWMIHKVDKALSEI